MALQERRLGELGELTTGFQVRSAISDVPEAPHQLITIGDVGDEGIDFSRLARMDLGSRIWRYALNPGDLLLRSRGANYKSAVVPMLDAPTVATAPMYVLRLQVDHVLPEFLVWWINRDETQEQLASEARGSYIPTVSRESFANLKVPIPPLDLQGRIADMEGLRRDERNLMHRVEELRRREIQLALEQAVFRNTKKK